MRGILHSSALALCVAVLPLPQGDAQNASQVQPPAGFPALGAPPTVTVISSGAEPRKALRFVIANGLRDHMTMDIGMTMAMSIGDNSMPEMKVPVLRAGVDLDVTSVSTTGDMTISTTFTDVAWLSSPEIDPSMVAMLNNTASGLKGLSGTIVMSDRGITRAANFDTSKISNPQLAQAMSAVQDTLQNVSLPLPEEPVGVGATWEVRLAQKANGLQAFNKYSLELTALDDTSCTLKVKLDQTAPPQSISTPAMGGATASLDVLDGTATGTTKIRFDKVSPTGEVNGNTKMTMTIKMGDNAQQMNMVMTMKMAVTSGVVK